MNHEISAKKGQVKALKTGKGLQCLLNEIYKILEHPVALYDLDYNLIAYADGVITDDPLWNELVAAGAYSSETIEFFKNEDWIDAVANCNRLALMTSDQLRYDRINGKIFDQDNIRIANITVTACNKPFGEDDPELIADICEILSKEIQESEWYQKFDRSYQEKLICDLLSGRYIDRRLEVAKLTDIDRDLKKYLYLAVVEVPPNLHLQLTYFRDLFRETQRGYKYYTYSGDIVILISTNSEKWTAGKGLMKLNALFAEHNMRAGISSSFDNLFELRRYYIEALDALKEGAENSGQYTFVYKQEGA